jgi:transcription antitermination factor NusG
MNHQVSLFQHNSSAAQLGTHWFALRVHTRKEAFVASQLGSQGVECFLPLYKSTRKWSDRVKEIQQPLFPSYLFSRFDYQDRRAVVMTPGVLQVVGNGRVALPIPDEEISAIQSAVTSGLDHQPWPYIEVGERVRVVYGSLSGLEGILINFKGSNRVVLSVSLLRRSVAVEMEAAWLVPAGERRQAASCNGGLRPAPVTSLVR